MQLSNKMLETLEMIKQHGKLIRHSGGFWSWTEIELKPLYNGREFMCMVPIWYCDVKTLRALQKRELVVLDEQAKECGLVN